MSCSEKKCGPKEGLTHSLDFLVLLGPGGQVEVMNEDRCAFNAHGESMPTARRDEKIPFWCARPSQGDLQRRDHHFSSHSANPTAREFTTLAIGLALAGFPGKRRTKGTRNNLGPPYFL